MWSKCVSNCEINIIIRSLLKSSAALGGACPAVIALRPFMEVLLMNCCHSFSPAKKLLRPNLLSIPRKPLTEGDRISASIRSTVLPVRPNIVASENAVVLLPSAGRVLVTMKDLGTPWSVQNARFDRALKKASDSTDF